MSPQTSAYVTVFFLIVGAIAVWIMLDVQGNPQKKTNRKTLTRVHKILGYLFILIYVIMCFLMIRKAINFHQAFSARISIHMVLAICLAPIILIKLGIAKRFKRFYNYLPVFGSVIFIFAFTFSLVASGYVFLHQSKIEPVTLAGVDEKILDRGIGKELMSEKCRKCHSLEPVLRASKSTEGWEKTINRMAQKDVPNIRPFEAKQIIYYLAKREKSEEQQLTKTPEHPELTGKALVQSKCTRCHNIDRVYRSKGDHDFWILTVEKMIENADEIGMIDFLTDKEKSVIVNYLENQK